MVQQPAARPSSARSVSKYSAIRSEPDVLEHADRGDGVEGSPPQVPVVLQPDLHPVADAGGGDALARQIGLPPADGDADDARPVVGRARGWPWSPSRSRRPAAACPGRGAGRVCGRSGRVWGCAGASAEGRLRGRRSGRTSRSSTRRGPVVELVADVVVVADRPESRRGVWRRPRGRISSSGTRSGRPSAPASCAAPIALARPRQPSRCPDAAASNERNVLSTSPRSSRSPLT